MSVVISLFDFSGVAVKPWVDAGYDAFIVDANHPKAYETGGVTSDGRLHKVCHDLRRPWLVPVWALKKGVAFVFAFPPCDHLSVSGSRWMKGKGLGALSEAIELFNTAALMCEWLGAPYLIENPVSTISTYWRKPDYSFHPHEFTKECADDNYTKKTCLWAGNGAVMPESSKDFTLGPADDRIHKATPGAERAAFRGKTPYGFSRAVFKANNGRISL